MVPISPRPPPEGLLLPPQLPLLPLLVLPLLVLLVP
jgi:hypothetical protein